MTTDIKAWVDEHRAIHAAATKGPWETAPEIDGVYAVKGAWSVVRKVGGKRIVTVDQTRRHEREHDENTAAIVDAHNVTVPTALSMIEAVLELHTKRTALVAGFGHEAAEEEICAECSALWPCRHVQALEGVIDDA